MFSRHEVIGRLVKDVEVRMVGQKKVANFTIACDDPFSQQSSTDFYNCSAWEKTADLMENYGKKGRLVFAAGRPKNRSYDKKQGAETFKQYTTDLNVQEVRFLDKKQDDGNAPEKETKSTWSNSAQWGRQATPTTPDTTNEISEDELPF